MLPAPDIRSNLGTWAVNNHDLPALANQMVHALPTEDFDANFQGQELDTTYFDTTNFDLRKQRQKGTQYLTLRLRCYPNDTYAFSAKTENEKLRMPITEEQYNAILGSPRDGITPLLPPNLVARLAGLIGDSPLVPVVTICMHRYAVEDSQDRLTLDVHIHTDTGKTYPTNVLEFKSTNKAAQAPLGNLSFRPTKLSKFLWATSTM
jgi:hypothetical protein